MLEAEVLGLRAKLSEPSTPSQAKYADLTRKVRADDASGAGAAASKHFFVLRLRLVHALPLLSTRVFSLAHAFLGPMRGSVAGARTSSRNDSVGVGRLFFAGPSC